ncbi:MAG: hypothetical protein ACFFBI_00340 [Promethearchaeota archaeon]
MGRAFSSELTKKVDSTCSILGIKAPRLPDKIDQICDKALELHSLLIQFRMSTKKYSFKDLLNQLNYVEEIPQKDLVMFYIYTESLRHRTVIYKMIMKRLSWSKSKVCSLQAVENLIEDLEKEGLTIRIRNCPRCNKSFNHLPDKCEFCGHVIITQKLTFKDKRSRPKLAVELTENGRYYVRELIKTYRTISSFFLAWYKYESSFSL